MPTQAALDPKLVDVLARICEQVGPITKTMAVKLPYLVDVVANHYLGHPITPGTHQTWDYGVVTREVFAFFTHRGNIEPFYRRRHHFSEDGMLIGLAGKRPGLLDAEELEIVDYVSEQYGRCDANRLGLLTKSLNTDLGLEVWGRNYRASIDEDAFARLSSSWFSFYEKLPLLDFSDRSQWGEPLDLFPSEPGMNESLETEERLARLERLGIVHRATSAPPRELIAQPGPLAREGGSLLAALLAERESDR